MGYDIQMSINYIIEEKVHSVKFCGDFVRNPTTFYLEFLKKERFAARFLISRKRKRARMMERMSLTI